MPVTQEIREALDLKNLKLPPEPKVIAIEVEDYVDWSNEDALRVTVILDESVDEWNLSGDAVWQIKSQIREALLSRGIRLFPYTFLAKPSELREEATRE
jgi:hypothetical protein